MCLIAKVIRISRAKFHCNRLTAVQDIQDYATHFLGHIVIAKIAHSVNISVLGNFFVNYGKQLFFVCAHGC